MYEIHSHNDIQFRYSLFKSGLMKKIVILSLLTVVLQSCVVLQNIDNYESYLLAGFGKTTIYNPDGTNSYVDPVGGQVGIESKLFKLSEASWLTTGLNVTFQGSDYVDPGVSGTVKLTYLNMPFLYTNNLSKKFYAEVGLQPGFLLAAKDKYNGHSDNYRDYISKFEVGLPVGVGYHLNDLFTLGVRGTYGLTNINSDGIGNDHNLLVVGMVRYNIHW